MPSHIVPGAIGDDLTLDSSIMTAFHPWPLINNNKQKTSPDTSLHLFSHPSSGCLVHIQISSDTGVVWFRGGTSNTLHHHLFAESRDKKNLGGRGCGERIDGSID
jgi:hypothetical protein